MPHCICSPCLLCGEPGRAPRVFSARSSREANRYSLALIKGLAEPAVSALLFPSGKRAGSLGAVDLWGSRRTSRLSRGRARFSFLTLWGQMMCGARGAYRLEAAPCKMGEFRCREGCPALLYVDCEQALACERSEGDSLPYKAYAQRASSTYPYISTDSEESATGPVHESYVLFNSLRTDHRH